MNHQRRALLLAIGGLLAVSCAGDAAPEPLPPETIREAAVQVVAIGCTTAEIHGAGMMVADGRIATVAHVVAGATRVEVRGVHGRAEATIVYFDPILDVALLKVDPRLAAPVPIGSASSGDHGTVTVYRHDAPVELTTEVQRPVQIRTADIYGQGRQLRPGYELSLEIQPGDSGAVVVVGGKAVALLWATSQVAEARTWAMRAALLSDHLENSAPVDSGHCA